MRWPRYHRGWLVWNPGAGGGGGTVQTDGVTIQGDGSAGNKISLKDAITDGTSLQGAGTSGSKLSIKPQSFFTITHNAGTTQATTANTLCLYAFLLPYPLTFSTLMFYVQNADASNNVDLGIYNASGALVADIGAQILTGGQKNLAFVQGSQTQQPAIYYFGITSAGSTFAPLGGPTNGVWTLFQNVAFGASVGGALPNSITPPAKSPTFADSFPWFALY